MQLYTDTLPKGTELVLEALRKVNDVRKFYLSGGIALSLQLGHRESEDLDFFTETIFQPLTLQKELSKFGVLKDVSIDEGTLNLFLNNIKLQFLYYPYSMLEELIEWNGINLSSVMDIACTKLITVSDRGSKKDFVDLYFILQQISLDALFKKLDDKYKNIQYNHLHILKSLVYFEDAQNQPMPRMRISTKWESVKDFFVNLIRARVFQCPNLI